MPPGKRRRGPTYPGFWDNSRFWCRTGARQVATDPRYMVVSSSLENSRSMGKDVTIMIAAGSQYYRVLISQKASRNASGCRNPGRFQLNRYCYGLRIPLLARVLSPNIKFSGSFFVLWIFIANFTLYPVTSILLLADNFHYFYLEPRAYFLLEYSHKYVKSMRIYAYLNIRLFPIISSKKPLVIFSSTARICHQ